MTTKYDLTNATAAVEEYLRELQRPDMIPGRIGRSWIEFLLERHGIIGSVRSLRFMESHALWYACLVVTGNVRRVSRIEKGLGRAWRGQSTETTIRRMLNRQGVGGTGLASTLLHEILEAVGHKAAA